MYTGVQGAPGPTPDFGCLLDPIWGASTSLGLPYDFMLFRSPAVETRCCVLPTREGHAVVWIHPDHFFSAFRFMGVVWWYTRKVDALFKSYGSSKCGVRCARSVCQRLHRLILLYFPSFHDTRSGIRSSTRWSCSAAPSRPSGPKDRYPSRVGARSTIDICEARCGGA